QSVHVARGHVLHAQRHAGPRGAPDRHLPRQARRDAARARRDPRHHRRRDQPPAGRLLPLDPPAQGHRSEEAVPARGGQARAVHAGPGLLRQRRRRGPHPPGLQLRVAREVLRGRTAHGPGDRRGARPLTAGMADRRRSSRRLLDRLTAARARHHERHRPSGFGFALADSIDYVDPVRWDAVASGASLFLQRRYLAVLERAGPDNLAPRYALIYRGRVPVAAVVMQVVSVAGTRFMKLDGEGKGLRRALVPAARKVGEALRERVLVCGNLLSWGFHAAAFAPGAAPAELWPAVAEAIYRVRRAERLAGETDFALVRSSRCRTGAPCPGPSPP